MELKMTEKMVLGRKLSLKDAEKANEGKSKTSMYRAHIMTDKQVYKPGMIVRSRVVLLNPLTFKPIHEEDNNKYQFKDMPGQLKGQILSPDDSEAHKMLFNECKSVYYSEWAIPQSQKGGTYKIKITSDHLPVSTSSIEFNIQEFTNPKMASQIQFKEDAYAPGQTVTAILEAKRLGNNAGPATEINVNATAIVDGENCFEGEAKEIKGDEEWAKYEVSFDLPTDIEKGIGSLIFKMRDGEILETRSKTIPIVVCSLDIRAFPEGGDLVQGLPTRLYIEAYNPHGEPADIKGEIIDKEGNVIGVIETVHEGRGRSNVFTPLLSGDSLMLKVTSPVTQIVPLSPVLKEGATMIVNGDIISDDKLMIQVTSTHKEKLFVKAYRIDKELVSTMVSCDSNVTKCVEVKLNGKNSDEGVLRLTLFTNKGVPLAERLVYREPRRFLDISVNAEGTWAPGSSASLKIKTELVGVGGKRSPTECVLCVNVTDESVRQMSEKRELAPSLPSLVMLNPEVDHLEDTEAYLNRDDEKAPLKMDLLLGTQGWRRFVFNHDIEKFHRSVALKDILSKDLSPKLWKAKVEEMMVTNVDISERPPMMRRRMLAMNGRGRGGGKGLMKGKGLMRKERAVKAVFQPEAFFQPQVLCEGMQPPPPPGAMPMPRQPQQQQQMQPKPQQPQPQQQPQIPQQLQLLQAQEEVQKQIMPQKVAQGLKADLLMPAAKKKMARRKRAAPEAFGVPTVHFERVYAHKAPSRNVDSGQIPQRSDFTETVYWAGCLKIDSTGEHTVTFDLSESVTTFKVMVDGFANGPRLGNGVLGSCYSDISSEMKFSLDAQLPIEVSEVDKIDIPILVHVDESLLPVKVQFMAQGFLLDTETSQVSITKPGQRVIIRGNPKLPKLTERPDKDNDSDFTDELPEDPEMGYNGVLSLGGVALASDGTQFWDGCQRSFRVKARGFPLNAKNSTILDGTNTSSFEFEIPADMNPESASADISLVITSAGSLVSALKALIREPYGCFEQTSSCVYPLIMAMQYFKSHTNVPQSMIESAKRMLKKGYDRLAGYESKGGGFEWFGGSPAHESLTAYGLMEFQDMTEVFPVDKGLIERARKYLLGRRSDSGEFLRNARALDSFGRAPSHITNAYILYALTGKNGDKQIDFEKEIEYLLKLAGGSKSKDPYFIALISMIMFQRGDMEKALMFARSLADMQVLDKAKAEGDMMPFRALDMVTASTSITKTTGRSLAVETAGVTALAWMNFPSEFMGNISSIIEFMHERCNNGNFGTTQGTVLALKSIVAYDSLMDKSSSPGNFWVKLNGEMIEDRRFDPSKESKCTLDGNKIISNLKLGEKNIIECGAKPDNSDAEFGAPLIANVSWRGNEPVSCAKPPVVMETVLQTPIPNTMNEGDGAQMTVKLANQTGEATGMVIAIVGLPGGLDVRFQRLKELVKMNKIAYYETRGRELILYWRCMKQDEEIEVTFDVIAKTPGIYLAPPSRCYMYYCPEDKFWLPEEELIINPEADEEE
eukprot:TRINITY_DN1230_c0_g1_i2.p1 TRINITY_DN1230_c0_g1~~TRINITY_DN1230_c0_g1_i2.p1  ORF type:complete len:1509 (-),score=581.75 TRINITY_DN1230_c0_g1_i2:188-4714(-)